MSELVPDSELVLWMASDESDWVVEECPEQPEEPMPIFMVSDGNAPQVARIHNALVAEVKRLRGVVDEYENALTWDTTCLNCSKVLDRSIAEYERGHSAGYSECMREWQTSR